MYKDNNTNKRPKNALNGTEGKNHPCIYKTIIKLITYEP